MKTLCFNLRTPFIEANMSFLGKFKTLDFFPKTTEDVRIRTLSGALLSIVAGLFIVFLFVSELSAYLETKVEPDLFVDAGRGEQLRINLDVVFPNLPCEYLSLDVLDISGEAQLDVMHNIWKRRLDKNGNSIDVERQKPRSHMPAGQEGDDQAQVAKIPQNRFGCGSCYGAETDELKCCETCNDVREAYRKKGWAFSNPDAITQCKNEGFSEMLDEVKDEGCQVYGYLMVQKVAGNFHLAPGKSFQNHHMHVHDLVLFKEGKFNLAHTIKKLSFGNEFPGVINPLDGVTKVPPAPTDPNVKSQQSMYQYFIKVVPTEYHHMDGEEIKTNQFSVTEYYRDLGSSDAHGLPGVFFIYDLSPIKVRFVETRQNLAQFLVNLCAILGGVYTVLGLVDSFVYTSLRSLKKKVSLGKFQ